MEIINKSTIRKKVFETIGIRNLVMKPTTLFNNDDDKKKILDTIFNKNYDDGFFLVNKSIGSYTKIISVKFIDDEFIDLIYS
jgi:hypothetical protein